MIPLKQRDMKMKPSLASLAMTIVLAPVLPGMASAEPAVC